MVNLRVRGVGTLLGYPVLVHNFVRLNRKAELLPLFQKKIHVFTPWLHNESCRATVETEGNVHWHSIFHSCYEPTNEEWQSYALEGKTES